MQFKSINVDGLNIFYREAGNKLRRKLVLLNGFPASPHHVESAEDS